MLTAAQVRGARAMVGMKQCELADVAGVPRSVVASFEGGKSSPHNQTLHRIQTALENAGIVFVDSDVGVGVMMKAAK